MDAENMMTSMLIVIFLRNDKLGGTLTYVEAPCNRGKSSVSGTNYA